MVRLKLLHLYVCHWHAVRSCWGICHVRETVWRNIISIDKGLVMLMLIVGHFSSSAAILELGRDGIEMTSIAGLSFYSHGATLGSWTWATQVLIFFTCKAAQG
jgi:hypothetical protein